MVENFHVFRGSFDNRKTFTVKFGRGYETIKISNSEPRMFSSELDFLLHPRKFFTMNNLQYTVSNPVLTFMQHICITIRVETGLGQFAYLGQIGHFFSGSRGTPDQTNKTGF